MSPCTNASRAFLTQGLGFKVTLGLRAYRQYLHWAPKSIDMTYVGLCAALGLCTRGPRRAWKC